MFQTRKILLVKDKTIVATRLAVKNVLAFMHSHKANKCCLGRNIHIHGCISSIRVHYHSYISRSVSGKIMHLYELIISKLNLSKATNKYI